MTTVIEANGRVTLQIGAGNQIEVVYNNNKLPLHSKGGYSKRFKTEISDIYFTSPFNKPPGSHSGWIPYAADVRGEEGIFIWTSYRTDAGSPDNVYQVLGFSLRTGSITKYYKDDGSTLDIETMLKWEAELEDPTTAYDPTSFYFGRYAGRGEELGNETSDMKRLFDDIINTNATINSTVTNTSTPTYNVSNTYAKNLVGVVLTGAPKLTQNTFDAKFYNLGGGRYGVQQKGKSTIDEITGVSNLSFNDKTVSVSSDIKGVFDQVTGKETKDAQMYRLYNAAFARFPDASGLHYWINEYTRGITDYRNIAQSFLNSEEFKTRYGANNSNTDFINNMYRNILGRLPDEEGRNYWVSNLDSGRDIRVNVLGGFAESTENKNLFSQVTGFT